MPQSTLGALCLCLLCLASAALPAAESPGGEAREGVALAIVFDTSGSMRDTVKDASGQPAAKYLIARRALKSVVDRLDAYTQSAAAGGLRRVDTCLVVFERNEARFAVPFGKFDAAALRKWADRFTNPVGSTPLGRATTLATGSVLASPCTRKHVLVITDGENTVGPDPATVIPGLQRKAGDRQASVTFHFVAFDVAAKVFDPLKKLGANVVSAANELQLHEQLQFILERKILLEEEEPPPAPGTKTQ